MIVPQYWSESKSTQRIQGKQFTLKRFGWSDTSEQAAKAHADQRLSEAIRELERQGTVRRIDHKTAYNGAEGIPIREEVVARHQDVIISRNSYGALCLNTPDVFFADIDFPPEAALSISTILFLTLLGASAVTGYAFGQWSIFLAGLLITGVLTPWLAKVYRRAHRNAGGGPEEQSMQTIKAVSRDHPELNIRVYRTPLGHRVLLMNSTYDPAQDKTQQLLEAFQSDALYTKMCRNQHCFRARVSPKPWRIGVGPIKPRPGVWPIHPERMSQRKKWVTDYEQAAKQFASCRFVTQMGSSRTTPKADFVRKLHDQLCQSDKSQIALG